MSVHRQYTFLPPPPHIPHAITVIVMTFAFHTKDPDGVGDALKTFVFPDLSPSVGLESALHYARW